MGVPPPDVPLAVEIVRPQELDNAELARWALLQREDAPLHSPFLGPDFALAVGRVREQTRVGVLTRDGEVVGYWPFELRKGRRAVALAMGLSDVQGMVLRRGVDVDLPALLRVAGIRSYRADHFLAAQAREGGPCSRWHPEHSPALDLRGGFEAYVTRQRERSRSLLQSTARKRRKLEREHGEVRLQLHAQDHATLDRVLAWKSDQYRRTGRRDRFADSRTLRLVHDLLELQTADFSAPQSLLLAGDRMVAAHVGVRSPTTLAWWFPVYDSEFAAYSPGLILCLDLAQSAAQDGVELLDLGKGDEPYKERLANVTVPLAAGVVAGSKVVLSMHTAVRWPQERALQFVLESPRLRGGARHALSMVGRLRRTVM